MKRLAPLFALFAAAFIAFGIGCHSKSTAPPGPPKLGAVANTGGTQAATVLGCTPVNDRGVLPYSTSLHCEQATDWVGAANSATTTIWSYDLAAGDNDHFSVDLTVKTAGGAGPADDSQFTLAIGATFRAGAFSTPDGGTSARTVYSDVGANLAGTSATLVLNGNAVELHVTCAATGPYCVVRSSASISHGAQELAVLAVSPTTLASTVTSTQTITITATTGSGQFVTGATIGTVPLTNCRSASPFTTITCSLLPGTYPVGSGLSVGITTSTTIPIALPGGFAFTSNLDSGVDASDAADSNAPDTSDSSDSNVPDSADAADSAGGDAGPPPTLSQVLPLDCPAAGGYTLSLVGTNFVNGMTLTVGATSGVATTVLTSSAATATCPAYAGGAAGTSTPQATSVVTAAGTGTLPGSFGAGGITYLAGTILNHYFAGVWTLTGGKVSTWTNMVSPGTGDLVQATAGNQFTVNASFFNSLPSAVATRANSTYMTASLGGIVAQPFATLVSWSSTINAGGSPQLVYDSNNAAHRIYMGAALDSTTGHYNVGGPSLLHGFTGFTTAQMRVVGMIYNGTAATDGGAAGSWWTTLETQGNVTSTDTVQDLTIGCDNTHAANCLDGNMVEIVFFGALTPSQQITDSLCLQGNSGAL